MTDVQQIIAAIGEDDLLAFLLVACYGRKKLAYGFYFSG
jgi:hypothetical protein